MTEPRPLHDLFGLTWMDFFQGTTVEVKTEEDLSRKKQFLDVVLIRPGSEPLPRRLPDGFEELAAHNLITFKSDQEALDGWALCELVGHYVNYRKQSSPSMNDLLDECDYRLFAVCARFPQSLVRQAPLTLVTEGVYEIQLLTLTIRIIVANQLPKAEHNAVLHLFSSRGELVLYGREHFRLHSQETSSLLYRLLEIYSEDPNMPDKLKEFVRETIDELLKSLPAEERLKGVPAKERIKGLSADEVLEAMSPQTLEEITRRIKANGSTAKPQ